MEQTEEQKEIVKIEVDSLIINAFAGAGKTSTLKAKARKIRDDIKVQGKSIQKNKILYLAYNRSMYEDAKKGFKDNEIVDVSTTHSLALKANNSELNRLYWHKVKKQGSYTTSQLLVDLELDGKNPDDIVLAHEVYQVFTDFLYSKWTSFERVVENRFSLKSPEKVLKLLDKIYAKKKDITSAVEIEHDFYLKLFQLQKPILEGYKHVFLDEAQDSNATVLDIVCNQYKHSNIVAVGDKHQQIYKFRKAVDGLNIPGVKKYLTYSFRIGQELADIVNKGLEHFKGEKVRIIGKNSNQIIVDELDYSNPYTIVCRTRAKVFENAVSEIKKGKKVHLEGGYEGYNFNTFVAAYNFFSTGQRSTDPLLRNFETWDDLELHIEKTGDVELTFLTNIVKIYKGRIVPTVKMIEQNHVPKNKANVLITTIHKSKGLEYNNMRLEGDCIDLTDAESEVAMGLKTLEDIEEEVNLWYVGLTRSKKFLELDEMTKKYCGYY